MLLKLGFLFHIRPVHTTVYCEKLHSLTVTKIIIWYKFLLLLDCFFSSEFFGKKIGSKVLTHYNRCWGAPLKAKYRVTQKTVIT